MKLLIATAAVLAAGCASAPADSDRIMTTSFQRALYDPSGTRFIYRARTGLGYQPDDAQAELVRMKWLDRWLEVNKLCPQGRNIENRDLIRAGGAAINSVAEITYVVSCR